MVDATMELATPWAPTSAASLKCSFLSFDRKQFSSTTLELSTIIPMAMTSAPRVMMFNEKPATAMTITVTSREMGMALPTIRLAFQSPKKMNSTIMDRITPMSSVLPTELADCKIMSDAS